MVVHPTVKQDRDQRHLGVIEEIAKGKFPFPNEEFPTLETIVNVPKPRLTVGQEDGKDLFPHIVVVQRPGVWLRMMAEVETAETLNDEAATTRWLPYSRCGDLYVYVPFGMSNQAKALVKKHKVPVKGIRTWRFRPVWGLDVSDV